MTASPEIVERSIKAVETVLNPLASSLDRASANQYCEGIKSNFGDALQLAFTFIPFTNGYPLPIRQFGLNLLEHVVKHLKVDQDVANGLLEQGLLERLWDLAMGPSGLACENGGEPLSIKEKLAVVFVQAAVRVWPQRWPGLLDMLMAEALSLSTNYAPRKLANGDLALIIIRMLVDEIHQSADADTVVSWDETRRAELQSALALMLPSLSEWLWTAIPNAASRSTPNDPASMLLLSSMIKCFGSVVNWVYLKPETTLMLVGTIFNVFRAYQELSKDILEALLIFSTRTPRTNEETIYSQIFDQEVGEFEAIFSNLVQACEKTARDGDQEEEYGHLKTMSEIILNMATITIGHKKHPAIPKQFGRFLQIVLSLSSLPSLVISSLSIIFWGAIIRGSEKANQHPEFLQILPSLFGILINGMAIDRKAERRLPWNRIDFDDAKEFEEVATATSNRISSLLQQIAEKNQEQVLGLLRSTVVTFVNESGNGETLKFYQSTAKANPRFISQWSAICNATEAIFRGLGQTPKPDLVAEMNSLLAGYLSIIDPAMSHAEIIAPWLYAVRGISVCLGTCLESSGTLLTGLFNLCFAYKNPLRNDFSKADPVEVTIKGRTSSILLKLASTSPSLFLPHIDHLIQLFQAQASSIQQQRLFTEIFLVLSGEMPEGDKRIEVMDHILRPTLLDLENIFPWLDFESFKVASGITQLFGNASNSQETAVFRKSISNLLASIYLIFSRLSEQSTRKINPLIDFPGSFNFVRGTILPRLHQFLLTLLATLERLAAAKNWEPRHQAIWHQLFDAHQSDETNVKATFETMDEAVVVLEDSSVQTIRGWLSTIEVSSLVSLGVSTNLPGFYSDFRACASLLETFELLTCSLHRMTWLWRHFLCAFLVHCKDPSVLASPQVSLLIDRLIAGTSDRLATEWAKFESDKLDEQRPSDLIMEMQREAELIMLSSTIVNTLYDVLYPFGERDKKIEPCLDVVNNAVPGFPVESKTAIWLFTADLARQVTIVNFLITSLSWKHSIGFGKVLLLLLRWLPTAAMNQSLHEGFFSVMPANSRTLLVPKLITILAQPDLSDFHNATSQLFCEIYKWTVFFKYNDALEASLISIPGLTAPNLQVLKEALLANPSKTAKQQREAIRAFLKPMQAEAAKEISGKTFRVGKLPDKLILLKKLKEVTEVEVTADEIDNLFA